MQLDDSKLKVNLKKQLDFYLSSNDNKKEMSQFDDVGSMRQDRFLGNIYAKEKIFCFFLFKQYLSIGVVMFRPRYRKKITKCFTSSCKLRLI